ncbi:ECF transporter S component [Companilactobacillus allii]|uniref:ECF transporter S component n=1 Tax=Companilactobacillus allii TaxID=1847728 RepID=A0A1P8Q5U6_9LACO|nr:ECF transporter S component [Companilactobacillus allii]APX73239.1 ECF transporter S component [Companilactobacillus allii]USQ68052.1 ECF transporter S component [Companilactobacillus allii]
MSRKSGLLLAVSIIILILLTILDKGNYLLLSFIFLGLTLCVYFIKFEHSQKTSREIVFIAIICALAVGGRVLFAALPSVKPELFILILGAMVSGPETGFLMGTIIAITSNMYFGQGAWTPWQMFALGIIGLISGMMANKKIPVWILTIWGFLAGFLMGWIMDIYYIIGFVSPITFKSVGISLLGSFYFDLIHAVFTAVLLLLVGKRWIKIFNNYKKKYNLFLRGTK